MCCDGAHDLSCSPDRSFSRRMRVISRCCSAAIDSSLGRIILESLIENRKHSFGGFAGGADDVDVAEFFKIGAIGAGESRLHIFGCRARAGLFACGPLACGFRSAGRLVADLRMVAEGFEPVGAFKFPPDGVGGFVERFHVAKGRCEATLAAQRAEPQQSISTASA